jgi:hypothetical protein
MPNDMSPVAAQNATLSLPNVPSKVHDRLAQAVAPPPERPRGFNDTRASAKAIKVSLNLDPLGFVGVKVPDGMPRFTLPVDVAGRKIRADLNCKAIRKAVAAVKEFGPDGVAIVLTGQLEKGDTLSSAGLSAMPKTPKPQSEVPAEAGS